MLKLHSFATTFYISQPEMAALSKKDLEILHSLKEACLKVESVKMQFERFALQNLISMP